MIACWQVTSIGMQLLVSSIKRCCFMRLIRKVRVSWLRSVALILVIETCEGKSRVFSRSAGVVLRLEGRAKETQSWRKCSSRRALPWVISIRRHRRGRQPCFAHQRKWTTLMNHVDGIRRLWLLWNKTSTQESILSTIRATFWVRWRSHQSKDRKGTHHSSSTRTVKSLTNEKL